MKLPSQKFELPFLENASKTLFSGGFFVRRSSNLSIHSRDGNTQNFILSVRAPKNTTLSFKHDKSLKVDIFQDYTFIFLEKLKKVEAIVEPDIFLEIRLCISYTPPLLIKGVELLERLNKIGRYRILTPDPHLGNLISSEKYQPSHHNKIILPLGQLKTEELRDLEIDQDEYGSITKSPTKIEVETTGFCNLKCVHCPQGIEGGMPYEDKPIAKKILKELDEFILNANNIHLHGYGEPLASPRTWEVLNKIEGTEVTAEFNTNGVLLNKKNIKKIMESNNLWRINVSIDTPNKERFYRIRGAELGDVISNVKNLLSEKERLKKDSLSVAITMVIMKENLCDVSDMIKLAAELKVPILIWNLKSNNTFFNTNAVKSIDEWKINRDEWLFDYSDQIPFQEPAYEDTINEAIILAAKLNVEIYGLSDWPNELFQSNENDYAGLESKPSDCPYYKDSLYVSSNGDVRLCCYQIGKAPIDNLSINSAEDIWKGQKMSMIRSQLMQDKIPYVCSGATCQYVKGK